MPADHVVVGIHLQGLPGKRLRRIVIPQLIIEPADGILLEGPFSPDPQRIDVGTGLLQLTSLVCIEPGQLIDDQHVPWIQPLTTKIHVLCIFVKRISFVATTYIDQEIQIVRGQLEGAVEYIFGRGDISLRQIEIAKHNRILDVSRILRDCFF